ncbi:hypothetical protein GHT06_016850 [Daphnia sinensis]|uniref:Uncharacterized protein n=1 Tax=Daphnia sinensis TaxID=1820382 RepID=A0AAD5PTC7_9CRUS|nr:hypothetical protein GHT06_016850 [Daphnia sinensis]
MDDAPKLDWMYAGPAGHVNTDEYLTGRAVDKTFEHFKLGGAEPLNLDLPAPTLPREKSSVPRIQVDVARKVQEDPLLNIRRQEEERKALLREQMLIQQRLTSHSKKTSNHKEQSHKRKERRNRPSSESSSCSDLDSKLALKLKQLKKSEKKESLDEKIAKKLLKLKKRRGSGCSSSSSSSEDDSAKHKGRKRTSHEADHERGQHRRTYNQTEKYARANEAPKSSSAHARERFTPRDHPKNSHEVRNGYKDSRPPPRHRSERDAGPRNRSSGMKLSEEEMEKRRREMMQDAVVRDNERKVKVDKYRKEVEEEAGQLNANRPKEAEFVKKQLATVTSNTTVEARIKANVFNIQRSVNSMDSNFARR